MTNRLVTDAAGFPALNGQQPEAMDEGFADWYALDMLNAQGFEPDTAAPGELTRAATSTTRCARRRSTARSARRRSACPGTARPGRGGYTYGDFGTISGLGPSRTPTGRSGWRRSGTSAPG